MRWAQAAIVFQGRSTSDPVRKVGVQIQEAIDTHRASNKVGDCSSISACRRRRDAYPTNVPRRSSG